MRKVGGEVRGGGTERNMGVQYAAHMGNTYTRGHSKNYGNKWGVDLGWVQH